MRPLLVCSLESAAGKTAVCVGLARRFTKDGLRVGYIKAITAGGVSDPDALFVKDVLSLPDPPGTLAPVSARSRAASPVQLLTRAASQVAGHSDVLLVEGGDSLAEGAHVGLSGPQVARTLDAKALLVLRYRVDLLDSAVVAGITFGPHLAGAIVNNIPPSQIGKAREGLRPALESAGIPVLGMVPQDRVLFGVSVREIAERLGGDVVAGESGLDELVERLMIGAMSVDGAAVYFRKHPNKAVVTGGDRPDVQLAALATPTRCLVLTGGFAVDHAVLRTADEHGVPVIVTKRDTLSAVETMNELFHTSRFHQKAKVSRLESLVADHVDAAAIRLALES